MTRDLHRSVGSHGWVAALRRRVGPLSLLVLGTGLVYYGLVSIGLGEAAYVLGFLLALSLPKVRPRRRRRPHLRLSETVTWPLPMGTFPVQIAFCDEIDLVSTEDATIAFVDGWLVAESVDSSFSLRSQDVWAVETIDYGLVLKTSERKRLEIRCYEEIRCGGETSRVTRNRFDIELRRWLDGDGGKPSGTSILPPCRALPMTSKERTLAIGSAGVAIAVTAFNVLDRSVGSKTFSAAASFWLGMGVGVALLALLRLYGHLRHRRSSLV